MRGLTSAEARKRLQEYGPNSIPEPAPDPLWRKFLRQFQSPLIYILIFALVFDLSSWWIAGLPGWPVQSITIAAILLSNAGLGVWQEAKSEVALRRLEELASPQCWIYRDGRLARIVAEEVVPGDLMRVEAGERIGADGSLDRAGGFMVDESVLTGESVPIDKTEGDAVFSGTLAVRGRADVLVTATGDRSSMGRLAGLLGSIEDPASPLERRLEDFGRKVAWIVVSIALVVLLAGLSASGLAEFSRLFLFAVALAVAAVPESLPAVLTLALARGVERMARRRAVVRRLAAVEALGSVGVIATDKTGTLTENKMQVEKLDCPAEGDGLARAEALRAMVLANDADLESGAGDPLERGLLRFAVDEGVDPVQLRDDLPRTSERSFDAEWKFMRATVSSDSRAVSYLKGAPEILLARCRLSDDDRQQWEQRIDQHAAQGFRALAFARSDGEAEQDLEWLGVALLWDPPRQEVPGAIRRAQEAGVRVMMVTGDHPATAQAIARLVHIPASPVLTGQQVDALDDRELAEQLRTTHVFARVTPLHKLRIVTALQGEHQTVAMTGDGVNDAPALKAADVGVAMGQRGSDVSREVADLVLMDDNFATIVAAIEEGRGIYENIQKFIRTLFSTNLSEVLLIATGALLAFAFSGEGAELFLPLAAVQILWMNLLTDSFPALALATDQNPGVMALPPRPSAAPLLDRASVIFVVVGGVLGGLVGLVLLLQLPAIGYSLPQTRSVVFCFLVFVQLAFVLPARRVHWNPPFNPLVWLAVSMTAGAQLLAIVLPGLRQMLQMEPLEWSSVWLVIASTAACWLAVEATSWYLRRAARASLG